MAATIAHFAPRVEALSARLPELLDAGDRARAGAGGRRLRGAGRPRSLAARVVTFDTLYSTLDIVEVAGSDEAAGRAGRRRSISRCRRGSACRGCARGSSALPGDQHWQMLAKSAMQDDLSGLQRTITGEVLAQMATIASRDAADRRVAGPQSAGRSSAWSSCLTELRAVNAADAAMLSVALRELRNLG